MIGNTLLTIGTATYISIAACPDAPINLNPDCKKDFIACVLAKGKLPSLTLSNPTLGTADTSQASGATVALHFNLMPSLEALDMVNMFS